MKTYQQVTPEAHGVLLTDLKISPSVFTAGDTIDVTFTLENVSGSRLTGYTVQFGYWYRGKFAALFDIGGNSVSMANRAVKSFQQSALAAGDAMDNFTAALRNEGERTRNGFMLSIKTTDNKWNDLMDYVPVDLSCAVIDSRYAPAVPIFGMERCDLDGNISPDGEMMAITATIGAENLPKDNHFTCNLYYAKGHVPNKGYDACVDLSDCLGALNEGVEQDATMLDGTFDRAYDWFFVLEYGDEYEAAYGVFTVGQSFTNRHESGFETGGVRYGGYSRSVQGKPLFESDYPGYFYNGIANIQAGVIEPVGMTGGGNCVDIPVTFDHPFADGCVPVVVAGFQSVSTAGPFGRCCVAVLSGRVTNTGFILRFYNGDSVGRNPAFSYIALGTPAPAI